jgi:hypothetical protein
MTYCYLGETKWVSADTRLRTEARTAAKTKAPDIFKILQLLAAAKPSKGPNPNVAKGKSAEASANPKEQGPEEKPPPLDLATPAPKGSFREQIILEVEFVQKHKISPTRKREATDSQKHLYEVLGGWVDLPIEKMNGAMGDRLVVFYNNPVQYRLNGPNQATIMRRFLKPMEEKELLPREFRTALEKVRKQCDGDEKSDPFRGYHYGLLFRQLGTGQEEDFLEGLFLVGCNFAPQIIDAIVLQWEGVDFKCNWIKFYRVKTEVIAEGRMSKRLRAWLLKRRQLASRDEVYVFWELICPDDKGKPDFNQMVITDDERIKALSTNTSRLWREFMHRAGVDVGLMAFVPGDIQDLSGFLEKLRLKATPAHAWFVGRCNKKFQKALLKEPATEQELADLGVLALRNLNYFVKGNYAFDGVILEDVVLRGQTKQAQNPGYTGVRLYTFHRLLLEDLFPELKKVDFTNYNYSYSSFRKHLVSFLRSLGVRDAVIARILGQDALDSQNAYDRVGECEHGHGCDLAEDHVDAMIEGREECFPFIPYDLYVKMVECFDVQEEALERLQACLASEMRALYQEAEKNANRRHRESETNAERRLQEVLVAIRGLAAETRALKNELETTKEQYEQRIAVMDQSHRLEIDSCRQAIVKLQRTNGGNVVLDTPCIDVVVTVTEASSKAANMLGESEVSSGKEIIPLPEPVSDPAAALLPRCA